MPRTHTNAKHTTATPSGTRAQIRIHGYLHRQFFRRGTDPIKIKEWLLKTEMKYRVKRSRRTGAFDDDAAVYLESVKAMPSYGDRKKHIDEWVAVFGHRDRDSISADEIRAQLHRWHTETRTVTMTRRPTAKAPRTRDLVLSASAVNKRRTALMHLYSVLDGKAEKNPVKDVPKFREPAPAPKGIPYSLLKRIFAEMNPSKSKARLMVIAYTGIPHAQLAQITAADVNVKAKTVAVPGRRKGAGTGARIVPLTSQGVLAFKAMAREEAWGSFSRATLRLAFRRACKAADVLGDFTTYDLRHSFGTEVYRRSGDIRATQILMDHSSEKLTHRYTLAAQDPRVAAAMKKMR